MNITNMTKCLKVFTGVAFMSLCALLLVPSVMQGRVADVVWQPFTTTVEQSSQALSVARVQLPQSLDRLQRIQGVLVAIMYPTGCANIDCPTRDVAVMRDGQLKVVSEIPVSALESERVLDSHGRVLWTQRGKSSARFNVQELNLETASVSTLARDVFLGDTSEARVRAANGKLYFEVYGLQELAPGIVPVMIRESQSNENFSETLVMNQQWRKSLEEIQDVDAQGRILTRLTFPSGDQELWYHQRTVERGTFPKPQSVAVEGSYTIDGHLVGVHFVDADTIEFFRYQTLMRYTISTGTLTDLGERLHWVEGTGSQEALVITAGEMLYFVGEDATGGTQIKVRHGGVTTILGAADSTGLWIDDGLVTAATTTTYMSPTSGSTVSRFVNELEAQTGASKHAFAGAMDLEVLGASFIYIDGAGTIHWNTTNARDETVSAVVGTGSRAYLVSETEVMWVGFDGVLRRAIVRPAAIGSIAQPTFYKTATSSTVYLVQDGKRWIVPNEQTYFTWASTFDGVQTIGAAVLNSNTNAGYLQMKPGTLIKTATSKHVMVLWDDWHKQRIANEAVALAIFGERWWQQIVVVDPTVMNQYVERPSAIESVEQYVR